MTTSVTASGAELQSALSNAGAMLRQDPAMAEAQAREILANFPESDPAQQILAAAYRLQGDPAKALTILEPLAAGDHGSADTLHELGMCLGAVGRGDEAIATLRRAVDVDPKHANAWRSLGDQLSVAGNENDSQKAFEKHIELVARHPELVEAATFLQKGALAKAERLTRDVLKNDPTDVVAIRMLAAIGLKLGQLADATHLLERCLELAPDFHLARHNYATILNRRNKLDDALEQVERLLLAQPSNPNFLILKGTILVRKGDHGPALEIFERILKDYPRQSGAQMSYGHTLKSVGRLDEAIEAYRSCIRLRPATGEAYWSLANLKTFRFDDEDIASIREQLSPESGDPDDQSHLAFALGKALEDRQEYDESFKYYEQGNAIRGKHHRFNPKKNIYDSVRQIRTLDAGFFATRKSWGSAADDPIFVVGLPRAGSTLIEQILASHSRVEGTAELPDIIGISRKLGGASRKDPAGKYPEILTELSEDQCRELGEGYIGSTRVQRHKEPFFIDKMPNNFQHIGLIHLILPNAKIIDARRHPMAGCFSCFKQLFARGQNFTYDLANLGHYYRDYAKIMDHWDEVLPGRVLRVQYEDMVNDTEAQIRRLLDYCELEFEDQCLRFYETKRAIRTPSSEQVRQPVYQQGLEQWRNYEEHLGPLKKALGPVLEQYPIT